MTFRQPHPNKQIIQTKTNFEELIDTINTMIIEGMPIKRIGEKLGFRVTDFIHFIMRAEKLKEDANLPQENREALAGILNSYAHARECQADTMAGKIHEIVEQVLEPDPNKRLGYNEARVAIDALKWTAAKLKPRVYGERLEQHFTGSIDIKPLIEQGRERLLKLRQESIEASKDSSGSYQVTSISNK